MANSATHAGLVQADRHLDLNGLVHCQLGAVIGHIDRHQVGDRGNLWIFHQVGIRQVILGRHLIHQAALPFRLHLDQVLSAGVQILKHLHLHHIEGFRRHLHGTGSFPPFRVMVTCASVNWLLLRALLAAP